MKDERYWMDCYPEDTPNGGVAGPGDLTQTFGDAAQGPFVAGIFVSVGTAERVAARRAQIRIALFCTTAAQTNAID